MKKIAIFCALMIMLSAVPVFAADVADNSTGKNFAKFKHDTGFKWFKNVNNVFKKHNKKHKKFKHHKKAKK